MANFCTNCGNPVGENDGFCINCGKKILKIQGQTQPKTLDLIAGLDGAAGNSAAGAVSATANIRNPFLTLFSGARSLVFGFPNLLKKPKALIIAIALTILWTVLGIVNWRGNTNLFTDILSWPVFAKAGRGGSMAGICGLFLSLGAVTSKTGFIHSFAASLSGRKT